MTSNIVPGNIDGTYPVAGQDNSSQGFRDNFTAIKNNFTEAKTEIEDLQTNKASTNTSANFNDNVISRARFTDTSLTVYDHGGTVVGAKTLNHENGHYQRFSGTSGNFSVDFSNFPSTGAGRIILDVTYTSASHVFAVTSNTLVASNVSGFDASGNEITVPTAGRYLYEFIAIDGSTTVLMHQLGALYTTTP